MLALVMLALLEPVFKQKIQQTEMAHAGNKYRYLTLTARPALMQFYALSKAQMLNRPALYRAVRAAEFYPHWIWVNHP